MYLLHACHSFWSQEAEIELSKPCSVIAHFFLNHVNHAYHARLKYSNQNPGSFLQAASQTGSVSLRTSEALIFNGRQLPELL